MAKKFTRNEIRKRFESINRESKPVLVTGAGIGIAAKFAEYGGSDMILISNGSYLRMDGHSSVAALLPYGNANDIVAKTAERISPVIDKIPMAAGVCGTDPATDMRSHLETLDFLGFSAVMNSPSVGVVDGKIRKELEHAGLGFEREINMLKMAAEMDFYTMGIAYDSQQAVSLAEAGVDAVVCDMGFTIGGYAGASESQAITLEKAVDTITEMAEQIRQISKEICIFVHGGPIIDSHAAAYIFEHTCVSGLLAESAIERIPVEQPLVEAVGQFKNIEISKL